VLGELGDDTVEGLGRMDAVVTARGDEVSFLERGPAPADPTASAPAFVRLETDHYGMLRDPGVDELAKVVVRHTPARVR
jgi:hypothetical protein